MSERESERLIYPVGARVRVPNIAAAGVVIGQAAPVFEGGLPLVLVEIHEANDKWLLGCIAVRYEHQLEATPCD